MNIDFLKTSYFGWIARCLVFHDFLRRLPELSVIRKDPTGELRSDAMRTLDMSLHLRKYPEILGSVRTLLPLLLLGILITGDAVKAEGEDWQNHLYAPKVAGIEENPLKGMMPYQSVASRPFPHSMEWFYLPLADLQRGDEDFDWEPIESRLAAAAGRGNHSVFRIYLDYPGQPVGTPRYLVEAGVQMREYSEAGNQNGVSKSPDWNDTRLIVALENFIRHFGNKYDGDPRIGFLTAGLYGFWGEWHNHPHDPEWTMKPEARNRILSAYLQSFTKTLVLLRDPKGTADTKLKEGFGYHDDSFAYETLTPEWAFLPRMRENGLGGIWLNKPIGGEIRPELQATIFDLWPNPGIKIENKISENLVECIKAAHASWMLNEGLFTHPLTDTQRTHALSAQRLLGYEFQITASSVYRGENGKFLVKLKIKNAGVAPFYYQWPAEFAAYDPKTKSTRVLGQADNWNLIEVVPNGKEFQREFLSIQTGDIDGQRLLFRFVNPLRNGKPLRFANARQDEDREGWLTLQDIPAASVTSSAR